MRELVKSADIVLVRFPFTGLEGSKKRPALVLKTVKISDKNQLIIVAMITSKTEGLSIDGDVLLKQWQRANLLHPSLLRLSKIATLDIELIDKQLGSIAEEDLKVIKKKFRKLFEFWGL